MPLPHTQTYTNAPLLPPNDIFTTTYQDLVYICFAVEDEMCGSSLTFWFRCLDLDSSGFLSKNSVYHFIKARDESRALRRRRGVGGRGVGSLSITTPPMTPPRSTSPTGRHSSADRGLGNRVDSSKARDGVDLFNSSDLSQQLLKGLKPVKTACMGPGDAHSGVTYSRMAAKLIEQVTPLSHTTGPSQQELRKYRGGAVVFHHLVGE